ncbi:heterokaryon incompatibility protein-domain-containing protein [Triangularia setosa]|uniref:Heterokaryon incompatibility protein-domain-containing protein n=1 Tax=Triangularia setosa TaxID=2587417 RepID=A0AAN6W5L9_9PEZI|nr:heterokaryon incompatibility protein-domain-containing protein [Podospora setosa]
MSTKNTSFPYPTLEAERDALRILTIEPGDFADPLICTLDPFLFSEKPKYVALSYTWGSSYPDNTKLPLSRSTVTTLSPGHDVVSPPASPYRSGGSGSLTNLLPRQRTMTSLSPSSTQPNTAPSPPIVVNNHAFHIRHNLHLALLHLRSSTHPISLWADAVCINQSDTAERNRQVSLMSFIYTRASYVVVWLGAKNHTTNHPVSSSSPDPAVYRSMSLEWKAGQTQYLAVGLIPQTTAPGHSQGHGQARTKIRYSLKPPQGTLMRLAESTYWTRLWVVQEVCLPRSLLVVYGSDIWAYEEFQQWVQVNGARTAGGGQRPPLPQHTESEPVTSILAPMRRLLETREKRHTSMMTLESLVERFAGNECSELRDRIYGLLGCANDTPTTSGDHGVEERLGRLRVGHGWVSPRPREVTGLLKVDYNRSFYDLWRSVVGFVYHHTKSTSRKTEVEHLKGEERRITIVRTAGIIQRALGQKLGDELPNTERPSRDHESIKAIGYIAGEIVQLGPGYSDLVGSYRAQQEWTACWDQFYDSEELSKLRQMDEEYMVEALDYEEEDLGRIRNIPDPFVIGSRVPAERAETMEGLTPAGGTTRSNSGLSHFISSEQESFYVAPNEEGRHIDTEARICLGTGYLIALVPPAARVGDIVVRFWNCNAAIVMRPLSTNVPDQGSGQMFMLVGRADVAGSADISDKTTDEIAASPEHDAHFEQCAALLGPGGDDASYICPAGYREGCSQKELGAIYVDMGLRTLQMITANVEV